MSVNSWTLSDLLAVLRFNPFFRGRAVIKQISLLLLCCHIPLATAEENSPKQIEPLPDPTVSTTEKLRSRFISPASTKNEPSSNDIKDPTNMNENFRAALNRLDKNKAPTGSNANSALPAPAVTSFPVIKLLAVACEHHPEKNHAMLSVNGKSEMVGFGEKMTTLVNNQVVEIEVLEIQKNHVRLRLHPNNETIILR